METDAKYSCGWRPAALISTVRRFPLAGFNWYDNEESVRTFCCVTQYDAKIYTCYISSRSLGSKCTDVKKVEGFGSILEYGKTVLINRINDNELNELTSSLHVVVEQLTCQNGIFSQVFTSM